MSLISNTACGRRHSKLFTNCHVSWDTLYTGIISGGKRLYRNNEDDFLFA